MFEGCKAFLALLAENQLDGSIRNERDYKWSSMAHLCTMLFEINGHLHAALCVVAMTTKYTEAGRTVQAVFVETCGTALKSE